MASYYSPAEADPADPDRGRRRLVVAAVVVALLLLGTAAFLAGRRDGGTTATVAATAPTSTVGAAVIGWERVGSRPVPTSSDHGPARVEDGTASGFSRDALGAVLATLNIGARITAEAGAAVYETTLREQCFGDTDSTLDSIQAAVGSADASETVPSEIWWRISGGDPTGDLVTVAILARTPQSEAQGGYAGLDRTLRWERGDWRLQVPGSAPTLVTSTTGYELLGRP